MVNCKLEITGSLDDLVRILQAAKADTAAVELSGPEEAAVEVTGLDENFDVAVLSSLFDESNVEEEEGDVGERPPLECVEDHNGVAWDGRYCAKSKSRPFYSTGTRTGQWIKARGLDFETYDSWYKAQLLSEKERDDLVLEQPSSGFNPEVAFAAAEKEVPPGKEEAPADVGELMRWVNENEVPQHLMATAFSTHEHTLASVCCLSPEAARDVVRKVYDWLVQNRNG